MEEQQRQKNMKNPKKNTLRWRLAGSLAGGSSMSSISTWQSSWSDANRNHSNVYFNLWQTSMHWVRMKSWSHAWEEFGKSEYVLLGRTLGIAGQLLQQAMLGTAGVVPVSRRLRVLQWAQLWAPLQPGLWSACSVWEEAVRGLRFGCLWPPGGILSLRGSINLWVRVCCWDGTPG